MPLQSLLDALPNLSPVDYEIIDRAYHKAQKEHEGQFRKSGEPYFTHCEAVALILADMHMMDAETIAAALMHDIIEDTPVTYEEVEAQFNATIANLVDGVTKLDALPIRVEKHEINRHNKDEVKRQLELEYFRRMLMTVGDDVRVVLIKLADRLHNMRTLGHMPPHKQIQKARETMEIFAPLANRLGIWQLKWELEDLAFRYLEHDAYRTIAGNLDERRADREAYMDHIVSCLEEELVKNGIHNADISGRPKHIYSIYKKMVRKDVPFREVYDVRAVRVIVETIPQCYQVLGIAHNKWRPIPGEFDDYIASPKDNFYQSLHTAVLDDKGRTVEVQIRTWDMHEHAEYGVAAHWRYKEGNAATDAKFNDRISYFRRLMEMGLEGSEDAKTFIEHMKSQVFENRVYAFTPKGDIIDLPEGATAIDFAYHVHTEIGHRCRGAKIQGRLVSLNYQLKIGDQVDIITAKRGGPSLDWLNPDLGYVKTNRARTKIRHWFRKQNRDNNISSGRALLDHEMKKLGVSKTMTFESVAKQFDFDQLDDFFAAIGAGDINAAQIDGRILDCTQELEQSKKTTTKPAMRIKPKPGTNGIQVLGGGGFLVNLARCCQPVIGDDIVGFITRGRGVTVHRTDCPNVMATSEPERLVDVSWSAEDDKQCYTVHVEIIAFDREGLMRDISSAIAEERINMSTVNVSTQHDIATFNVTMELKHLQQLTKILGRVSNIPNVVEARRHHAG